MPFDKLYKVTSYADTNLVKPIKVGNCLVQHRAVLSPLTRLRSPGNIPITELVKTYYEQRSAREGTLIITEGTLISEAAGGYTTAPGIYSDEQVSRWKIIYEGIHKNKSFVFQQLWALGRQGWPDILKSKGLKYVSASDGIYIDDMFKGIALKADNPQIGLTIDEIKQYVKDYVNAAKNAINAGADGVEVHAANGYLLNQFFDVVANARTDEYGGSIEKRSRFSLEVIDALIDAIGAEKVGIRLSPFGQFGSMAGTNPLTVAQFAHFIGELEKRAEAGKRIAYIHVMEPRVANVHAEAKDSAYQSNDFIYSIWRGVLIRAGDYAKHPVQTVKDLNKGQTLIAYGRYFIANPDLPDRLEKGLPLNAYDRATFYAPDATGYTDYPKYEEAIKDEKFLNDDLSTHTGPEYFPASRA